MGTKKPLILRVLQETADRKDSIRRAAEALRNGSMVIMPTDTVYGVAVDPRVAGAEEKIFIAKSRDRGKPIPLLASGLDQVKRYGAELGVLERKLAKKFWPGPLTLVLRVGAREEGFRVPDHDVALELLRAVGGILRVTSANLSGEPPALTAEEAIRSLGDHVDVVLDAGKALGETPSTVVRIVDGRVVILREGAISAGELSLLKA